jgi:hypothetical protein
MLAQLVKTIKRLVANVTHKWVEVGLVIVHARLSLIHARYVTISNKVVIIIVCLSLLTNRRCFRIHSLSLVQLGGEHIMAFDQP